MNIDKIASTSLAKKTGEWILERIAMLENAGLSSDEADEDFSAELYMYVRISSFPFRQYPDYTAPWHLLRYPHMRWDHVYHVVKIIESFRQPTGSHVGERINLEPFQVMILLCFLGPEDPDTRLRKVKEGLLTLARKQGKTAITAGLTTALMALHPDDHGLRGQEIQVGAADRDQAGIMHQMCERFVQLDDILGVGDKFKSVPSKKTLTHKSTLTKLRCLSSDAYRQLGGNPVMVLLDEIGNVPGGAAEDFYSALTTGYGAQEEPLTILLSTQAPNDQHFFSQQVDRAKAVNSGQIEDESFAGFVFTVPEVDLRGEDLDPFDENLWYLACPGIDTIYHREDMHDWAKRAKSLPSLQNKYENLKLNRRVSQTSAFLSRTVWAANNAEFSLEDLEGRTCTLGLDLSETTDLSALVALFEPIDGRQPVLPFYWIPGDGIAERSRRDKVPYDAWARAGLIDISSPKIIDYGKIADQIMECMERYDVTGIGFDRWKMKYLRSELEERGLSFYDEEEEDAFLIEIGQGFKDQTRSVSILEQLAVNEKLAHANHAILLWNVSNAVTVRDPSGNRKFEKAKSFGRIDGCVALALAAHARAESDIGLEGESMYAGDGPVLM